MQGAGTRGYCIMARTFAAADGVASCGIPEPQGAFHAAGSHHESVRRPRKAEHPTLVSLHSKFPLLHNHHTCLDPLCSDHRSQTSPASSCLKPFLKPGCSRFKHRARQSTSFWCLCAEGMAARRCGHHQLRLQCSASPYCLINNNMTPAKKRHQRQHTLHVLWGVWVCRSQNLSVVSPLPLASWRPSGLNAVAKTASV